MSQSESIRVLFVAHTGRWCGPTNSLLVVLRHLSREVISPVVLFPRNGEAAERYVAAGIPSLIAGDHDGFVASAIPKLWRNMRKEHPHIVYLNNFSGSSRNAAAAAVLGRRKLIWHIREMLNEGVRFRNRFLLRCAKQIVAVSEACAEGVAKVAPMPSRISVVHNAIDDGFVPPSPEEKASARREIALEFGLADDSQIALNLGTISRRKGQDMLLEVARRMADTNPKLVFLCVGKTSDPDFYHALLAERAQLGLEERFLFGKFRPEVRSLLAGSDVLIHTARKDPFPRVIIESMAMALPVVAFAVDGCTEAIEHAENGYLIEPFAAKKMAESLQVLLEDADLRNRIGQGARRSAVSRFSAKIIAGEVERTIEAVYSR